MSHPCADVMKLRLTKHNPRVFKSFGSQSDIIAIKSAKDHTHSGCAAQMILIRVAKTLQITYGRDLYATKP